MKFTNVKQLIIKFMGGGLINFPTRFLRWVKINGDTENDDGGGDTPVSNVKPWLKGLCINENLPEDVQQLPDCFNNVGFVKAMGSKRYVKLTDEEIANYNEESLLDGLYVYSLFDSEKIEEYLTQQEIEIPEINNIAIINSFNGPTFLIEVHYYYQTGFSYSLKNSRLKLRKITASDNKIYYIGDF